MSVTYLGSTYRESAISIVTGAVEARQCSYAPRTHDPDEYACVYWSGSVVAWATPQGDAAVKPGTSICEDRDDWVASRCYTADVGVGSDGYSGRTTGAGGYFAVCESYGTVVHDRTTCVHSGSTGVPTWLDLTWVQQLIRH